MVFFCFASRGGRGAVMSGWDCCDGVIGGLELGRWAEFVSCGWLVEFCWVLRGAREMDISNSISISISIHAIYYTFLSLLFFLFF